MFKSETGARISRGELAPADMLPNEAGLSAEINVSRTALREAIKAGDASVARAAMEELLSEAVQDSRRIMDEDEENRQLITETETHG